MDGYSEEAGGAVGVHYFFDPLTERQQRNCGLFYETGLALTFFDAVIVVLSVLGVIAFAPTLSQMRTQHWATGLVSLLAVLGFYFLLFKSLRYAGSKVGGTAQ